MGMESTRNQSIGIMVSRRRDPAWRFHSWHVRQHAARLAETTFHDIDRGHREHEGGEDSTIHGAPRQIMILKD